MKSLETGLSKHKLHHDHSNECTDLKDGSGLKTKYFLLIYLHSDVVNKDMA